MILWTVFCVSATTAVGRVGKETVGTGHAAAAGTAAAQPYPTDPPPSDRGQEESRSSIAAVSLTTTAVDAAVTDHSEAVPSAAGYRDSAHGSGAGSCTSSSSGSSSSSGAGSSASTRRR